MTINGRERMPNASIMPTTAPFGSWVSPLTPGTFSQGNCTLICELEVNKYGVFWTEQSCTTGKRALFFESSDGEREQWAVGHSVQSYVHEYGGGSFQPTPEGGVIFSTKNGLYEQETASSEPVLLISSDGNTSRFADFSMGVIHIFAVHESHLKSSSDPDNVLVSIDRKTKKYTVIAKGADFYAYPRVSPNGEHLVWMEWDHINMPWDETSICLADVLDNGEIENIRVVRSGRGRGVNYNCPSWSSSGQLFAVQDGTNWWNVYEIELQSGKYEERNIYPAEKEIGHAVWTLGDRRYSSNGRQTVLSTVKELILLENGVGRQLSLPDFNHFIHLTITPAGIIYCIAAGPKKSSTLLKITVDDDKQIIVEVVSEARRVEDWMDISEPDQLAFQSDIETIHGYFYEPKNRDFCPPSGSLPPVILMGHGGPTCSARPILDLRKQFFTSRGFAIFDVDYRGSTGYGTRFRNLLRKQNGVADRDDMINGARMLISTGRVDSERICITGSSAGGLLLLNCLVASDIFKAAVSTCGVADIGALAAITEKFERHYNEVLIGKYPEEEALYYERTPSNHLERITAAVALLHGREDRVVPLRQSEEIFEKLRDREITTALQIYEGEGHGFRGAEAVKRSMEDTYFFLCKALRIEPTVTSTMKIYNMKEIQ